MQARTIGLIGFIVALSGVVIGVLNGTTSLRCAIRSFSSGSLPNTTPCPATAAWIIRS